MPENHCHAVPTARDRAKALILKDLGVRRVAAWCGVSDDTVYQWLSRGTEAEPIPPARVAAIVKGAAGENLDAPIEVLWPAMAGSLGQG